MIVTRNFVFVHLPRTGGTFVSEVIKRFFPSAREIGYHLPLSALPVEFSHLPVLGGVRNPWAFYASWYHHQITQHRHSPLFDALCDSRRLGFVETTRNALNLFSDDEMIDRIIAGLKENFDYQNKHVSNLTKTSMNEIRGSGLGFYSFRFHQMFGRSESVYFCRVESLRADLLKFFERLGILTEDLHRYVLQSDKKNTSDHRHYSSYYTNELKELVGSRDKNLIERYGYGFDEPGESV